MSNMPPMMLSAPLLLNAMTVRGIGPYLHGARLDIKPLTILCGGNGSGKSTWIEILRAFKEAVKNDRFPIAYLPDSVRTGINRVLLNGGEFGHQQMTKLTTVELREARKRVCKPILSEEVTEKQFGKPGVIGFEIEATRQVFIEGIDEGDCGLPIVPTSIPEMLLWHGEVPSGERIRLRWSLPSVMWDMAGLHYWVELELSDGAILRLQRQFESDHRESGNGHEDVWTFECSSAFFPDLVLCESNPIKLGTFRATRTLYQRAPNVLSTQLDASSDSPIAAAIVEKACENFLRIFHELIREMFDGVFPIGAVRHILTQESTKASPVKLKDANEEEYKAQFAEANGDNPDWEEIWEEVRDEQRQVLQDQLDESRVDSERQLDACETRNVGSDGSMTQEVHAHWAYNLMREPINPRCGAIDNSFHLEDFPLGVRRSIEGLPDDFLAHILSIDSESVSEAWSSSDGNHDRRNELGIQLLNSVITSRNLFARQFRPNMANVDDELTDMLGTSEEEQDERLSSISILSDNEVIRVNRLLLESVFNESGEQRCLHRTGYLFETFVSFWLKRFTQTPIKYGDFESPFLDESWQKRGESGDRITPPLGGLTDERRHGRSRGIHAVQSNEYATIDEPMDEPYDLYAIIYPPTASGSTPWHAMSTGFHQLAPIVVQAGLLRQNEIMAVENPEVHLHPSLQIEIAEFLVHQASAGKVMMIETHSDLFVRRILRAIRQEEIKQEVVRINFTHLEDGPAGLGFKHAQIESLRINDHGQIANWPPGFMDDDLKEADRWLAAIQSQRSLNDEE